MATAVNKVQTIREWRYERFLSQEELAERAGLSHALVSHAETGKNRPRPRSLRAIAQALGIEPAQIKLPRGVAMVSAVSAA